MENALLTLSTGLTRLCLDFFFNCLVYRPEELEVGTRHAITEERENGRGEISLAKVCYDILRVEERRWGSVSHSGRSKHRKIYEREYFLREIGAAGGTGAKFECKGFRKEMKNGMSTKYNVRADP